MTRAPLFASDLDNTLIRPARAAKPGDVCVETKGGRELSFMSREARALLKGVAASCLFVPVTTRSLEQYRRLDLGVRPRYAVVAHGALLLVDGEVDEAWAAWARPPSAPALPEICEGGLLRDVRRVEGSFIFAKAEDPALAVRRLEAAVDTEAFDVCAVHSKVYVIPKGLNKGAALRRLVARLSPGQVICAGDSELDLPMLEMADMAVAPEGLPLAPGRGRVRVPAGEDFARAALEAVAGAVANGCAQRV